MAPAKTRDYGRWFRAQLRNIAPLITLIALLIFFTIASPSFATLDNANNILSQVSITSMNNSPCQPNGPDTRQ